MDPKSVSSNPETDPQSEDLRASPRRSRTYQVGLRAHTSSLCSPSGGAPELSPGKRAEHRGKEPDWALHTPVVAPTYHQGQVAVDYGVEARYLHFSVQRRASMATAWIAQYGANVALTHNFALYLLSSLLSLELRGAVLVDVGPSNLMISAVVPYPLVVYGDTAGWDVNSRARMAWQGAVLRKDHGGPETCPRCGKVNTLRRAILECPAWGSFDMGGQKLG